MNATLGFPPLAPAILPAGTTRLARGRALHLDGARRGLQLGCISGRVWITRAGDSSDYLLGPGQQLRIQARGRIVVEALTSHAVLQADKSATSPL